MKKAIYTVGAVAAVLLVIGFGLLILAGWGSLVEYHASNGGVSIPQEQVRSSWRLII